MNNYNIEHIEKLRIHELRDFARKLGVSSPTTMKKEELIGKISNIINSSNLNDGDNTVQIKSKELDFFALLTAKNDNIIENLLLNSRKKFKRLSDITGSDVPIDIANADAKLEDVEIKDIESEDAPKGDVEVIDLSTKLLEHVGTQCDQYGIAIGDIEIKVLDLPEENKTAVYDRMITERNNIAAAYTAQGQSEAQIIMNTTDKEVSVMLSEANASADAIIAEGEAEYMRILSEAYNDPEKAEFYLYVRSLDTVRSSLNNGQTTLFLDQNSPIAQIFQGVQ